MANPEHEAVLREAQATAMPAVNLSGFDLAGVLFSSVRLEGADLTDADLTMADLAGGYFKNCNFRGAKLCKARITVADFRGANLADADLTACDLRGSILSGANLANANLTKALLVKSHVDGADFTGANLHRTDLRGARGLTGQQLASAANSERAILDEQMLAALGRQGDQEIARHGRTERKRPKANMVDLMFQAPGPGFGDLFLVCGFSHPDHSSTGEYGFGQLAELGFEQVDDYFGICVHGDPVIWLFPLINGRVVEHHPGPFDGIRLQLTDRRYGKLFETCLAGLRATLPIKEARE